MSGRPALLPVERALAQITDAMPLMGTEDIAIDDALSRVLAKDITASLNHPPHDVSAMDGYAVTASDLSADTPTLKVVGESAAGHPYQALLPSGCAIRIFTGAYLPEGADTIIIQEDTSQSGEMVTIHDKPLKGKFIRPKGQDFTEGEVIATKGSLLDARNLALIASAGHGQVAVRKKPKIAIISTGDELVTPGTPPKDGQIVSSNGVFLNHFLNTLGADVIDLGNVPDQDDALMEAFSQAQSADLIVTSGGASVGQHDGVARHMSAENQDHGGSLAFWRIAMRPGKPLIFGHLDKTPMLGLPGNPVSTGVCAMIFVAAAIRTMLGQDAEMPLQHAKCTAALPENDQRQDYLRARMTIDETGQFWVTPFNKQDSGLLKNLADADVLVMRPPHAPASEIGAIMRILMIPK